MGRETFLNEDTGSKDISLALLRSGIITARLVMLNDRLAQQEQLQKGEQASA
jgi:hypothetical protein